VKLLIDQNLPRRLVPLLSTGGHDVTHTDDVGKARTSDPELLEWCCAGKRMLVTADKKLTKYLASSGADCPSVLITRDLRVRSAEQVATMLIMNLPRVADTIAEYGNAVFVLAPGRPIRAELLPLGPAGLKAGADTPE
jgi:predicted nuclease of predicted toxin-antitoxin system